MPFNLLPTLLIQLFAVGYTPGPANIYSLSCAIRYGRKAALGMWWGLVCGFLTAAFAVAIALHLIGAVIGSYVLWLKFIGAAYIMYLAVRMVWNSGMSGASEKPCTFWNGFMVQFTNAKMILFDVSVLSTFVLPYSDRLADLLTLCLLLLIAGPGANLVWIIAGTALERLIQNYRKAVDIVLGIALGACALYIMLG